MRQNVRTLITSPPKEDVSELQEEKCMPVTQGMISRKAAAGLLLVTLVFSRLQDY